MLRPWNYVYLGLAIVSLLVLFLVGVTAGALGGFFYWVDDKCKDWFEEIYGE